MIKYAQNDFFPLCSTNPLFTRAIREITSYSGGG